MKRLFTKIVEVKPNEIRALWLGFFFHFLILTGYYITKPIRDSIGASNIEALPWMFTATLAAMLAANAAFAASVARMSRRKFIPFAYGFFIVVFVLFFIAMRSRPAVEQIWIGRGFFVWVSVFNLFNTAIFWAFMTDLFTVEQGKRLYGFIAVGGTLGAILGAYITKHYVREIGPANLLVIAAAMFAIAGFLVRFFPMASLNNTKPLLRRAKNQSADRSGRASRTFAARLTSWGLPQAFCFIRRLRPGRIFNRAILRVKC
jgi:AAA family ATP:ADP antiporter